MAVTAHLEIEVSKLQLLQLKKEVSEKPVKKSEKGEIREALIKTTLIYMIVGLTS